MRLREREKRDVLLRAFTGLDEDVYTFGEGVHVRAAIYPISGQLAAQVYGERVSYMCRMLYDGPVRLEVGMGVALKAALVGSAVTIGEPEFPMMAVSL